MKVEGNDSVAPDTLRRAHFRSGATTHGVHAVRRALRYLLIAATMATIALAGSVAISSAAGVAPQQVPRIQPASGEVVGVGHPVVVTFAQPVTDRARAEQTIRISAPGKPEGEFTWLDNNVVQWSPDGFWPAHSRIPNVRARTQRDDGAERHQPPRQHDLRVGANLADSDPVADKVGTVDNGRPAGLVPEAVGE